jgi:glycosyltransferase involved in cell wall biosynthesis
VVATSIGSFVERLAGRPLTWLVDPRAPAGEWLRIFERVRETLARPQAWKPDPPRPAVADFYAERYLTPRTVRRAGGLVDLRREGRTSIVVIPERLENGALSPCAYIRLLQPLDHPIIGEGFDLAMADVEEAQDYHTDIVVTQRYAVPNVAAADALAAHCRRTGAALIYDLDDDLLHIPREHPDAAELRPQTKVVQRMLRHANAVWVSTPALAESVAPLRRDSRVVPNGLDERLWADQPLGVSAGRTVRGGSVRILCMGTGTHQADFGIIEPALARLKDVFGRHVTIDMIGVTTRTDLPDWVNRPAMPMNASMSYPGFVNWITQQPAWDIGLAPLADTAFNRCKSAIKTLDYAALGMAVVASDIGVYRGSLADGRGGLLVSNEPKDWFAALCRLLRDDTLRRTLAAGALEAFRAGGTLASQAVARRSALMALVETRQVRAAV